MQCQPRVVCVEKEICGDVYGEMHADESDESDNGRAEPSSPTSTKSRMKVRRSLIS